jgi:Gpi18-like mannosyltransferase
MIRKNFTWWREWSLIIGIVLLALMVRKYLLPIHSPDYNVYLSPWYDFIKNHGGIQALKYNFSNYNEPYLYLLVIATHLPLLKITAIKSISIVFDLLLALFVYLIVKIKYNSAYLPILAALILLFLPTIFINSALWAQSDSIYTAFSLGGLYFLCCKKPFWSCIFFGLAFAFKLQAIFLFPLLFILWIIGEARLRYFLLIPFVYVLAIIPAYLVGRNFVDMLMLYFSQAGIPSRTLSLDAPNLFLLIPVSPPQLMPWKHAGVMLALGVVLILSFIVLISKRKMTNEIILKLALVFALVVPFLLPEIHDRYFYLADVLSLIYAFYFPKYFYVPIVVQLCSLESYIPFLMQATVINLAYLSVLLLAVITLVVWDLMRTLWKIPEEPTLVLPVYSDDIHSKTLTSDL